MPEIVRGESESVAAGAETEVKAAEATNQGVNSGEGSPPSGEQAGSETPAEGEKPSSMLSAVLGALNKDKEGSPASEQPGDKAAEGQTPDPKADEALGPLTEEEFKQYGARAQRRIRELVGSVNAHRQQLQAIAPKAEVFDQMDTYIREKGLTEKDVEFTFAIMAAVKEDKPEALEALKTIVSALEQRMGVQLPADLAEEVRLGVISQQRAQELSMARRAADRAQREATQVTERTQQERVQEGHRQLVGSVHQTVADWEGRQRAKDPDWDRKAPRMMEKIELEFRRNAANIRTPQDALALADQVLKSVNEEFRQFMPRPKPMKPVVGGNSSPKPPAAPSSMLDLVRSVANGG